MRLYNITTNTSGDSGMLQICDATGHWSAVCDFGWGCDVAVVACKQLGYDTQCELCSVGEEVPSLHKTSVYEAKGDIELINF